MKKLLLTILTMLSILPTFAQTDDLLVIYQQIDR